MAGLGQKTKTQHLTENILGQHLALSVAAHLVRTQLVPEPFAVHDAQHLGEMVDVVARALARVAPLYVQDPGSGARRQLMESELDGRSLSSVSIKRADLRQAIAILKATGIPELQRERKRAEDPKRSAAPPANSLETMAEIEQLLRPPLVPQQVERANRLLVSIARNAPHGRVANLAMQLMSAVHELRGSEDVAPDVPLIVARLFAAMQEAEKSQDG
jgi:hypothetical protein